MALTFKEFAAKVDPTLDKIQITRLSTTVCASYDAWGRQITQDKPQPAEIDITLHFRHRFFSAASSDQLDSSTINYGSFSKAVLQNIKLHKDWMSADDLNESIWTTIMLTASGAVEQLEIMASYPKGAHTALDGVQYVLSIPTLHGEKPGLFKSLCLNRCAVPALIGLNEIERTMKQLVYVTVSIDRVYDHIFPVSNLEKLVVGLVEHSAFGTLEALAEQLARNVSIQFLHAGGRVGPFGSHTVIIRIDKPSAITMAEAPRIEICRNSVEYLSNEGQAG